MTVTVTDDHTNLDDMDASTDQDSDGTNLGNTGQTNTDIKVQGTASNMYQAKGIGVGTAGKYNSGNDFNLSNTHLYCWFRSVDYFNTETNGGYRIRVTNDALNSNSNFGEWTMGGRDTRRANVEGFIAVCVDTSRSFDYETGTAPGTSSVDGIGMGGDAITQSGQNTFFVDQFKTGSLITVTAGTIGNSGISSEIATADETDGRGAFKNIGGIFYILSGITIGDITASTDSYFRDENEVWMFEDQPVSNTLYTMTFVGGTGTNEASFGTEVGSGVTAVGVGGNSFVASGAPFLITATDSDINVNFLGCNFLNSSTAGGNIRLEQANVKSISCLWNSCDTITIRNGAIFRKHTITDSTASSTEGAVDFGGADPATDTVRDLSIQNCSKGILLQGSGNITYNFRNIKFAGNTNDVRVDFGGGDTVTINILEGGDTPTIDNVNGSTVNVVNAVTLSIHIEDPDGNNIQNAQTAIYQQSDDTQLMNEDTDVNGNATETFDFTSDTDIYVRIRKSSSGETRFFPFYTVGTITSDGFTLSVTLQPDLIAS